MTSGACPCCLPLPWCATAGTATAAQSTSASAIRIVVSCVPEPPQVRLVDLHEHIRTHRGCGFAICEEALNLVPGEGPEDAEVMVVGEAPGRFEDEQGRPFVGRAGQLLDELLGGGRPRARARCSSRTSSRRARRATATPRRPRWSTGCRCSSSSSRWSRRGWSCRSAATRSRTSRRRREDRRGARARDHRARARAVPALPPGGGAALDEAARDAVRRRARRAARTELARLRCGPVGG